MFIHFQVMKVTKKSSLSSGLFCICQKYWYQNTKIQQARLWGFLLSYILACGSPELPGGWRMIAPHVHPDLPSVSLLEFTRQPQAPSQQKTPKTQPLQSFLSKNDFFASKPPWSRGRSSQKFSLLSQASSEMQTNSAYKLEPGRKLWCCRGTFQKNIPSRQRVTELSFSIYHSSCSFFSYLKYSCTVCW